MEKIFYDAFISYRHTELDSYIAKKLHEMLEHYRIPKKIQKSSGKKKITRIFRDQEELTLSADLSENIKTALEHSEFLIVICSPEAMESRWVKTEIETFLKTHSKENVLTILAHGEPEEAFPEILCYREQVIFEDGKEKTVKVPVEPLAADIRAVTKEEAGKKLEKEILRILAPMLSCRFDDLRQRQKEYKTKWIIRILSAVMCLAVAFAIYSARQKSAIEEQYQASRRNQARYLCNVSDQLLKSGDREGALLTSLAMQTEDGKEPLVPEQMYALNNALYSYQHNNSIYLDVECALEVEHPVQINYSLNAKKSRYVAEFSPEASYLFVMDKLGTAYAFDGRTGECIYQCRATDFLKIEVDEYWEIEEENFRDGVPISEKELLLMTDKSIVIIDIDAKKMTEHYLLDEFLSSNFRIQNKRIVFLNYDGFYVYDLEKKEILLLAKNYISSMEHTSAENVIEEKGFPVDVALSPSAKQLAVVFSPRHVDEILPYVMKVYSLDTGECCSWEIENFDEYNRIVFLDEERLASLWVKENEFGQEGDLESYRPYSYGVYEIATGELLWDREVYGIVPYDFNGNLMVKEMDIADEKDSVLENMLICYMGNQMEVVLANTGELLSHAETNHLIVGLDQLDSTRMFVGTEKGDIYIATTTSEGYLSPVASSQKAMGIFMYASGSDTSAVIGSDGKPLLFYRVAQDENMQEINLDMYQEYYNLGAEGNYSVFLGYSEEEPLKQQAVVRNLRTGELLGKILVKEENYRMDNFQIFQKDSQEQVLYILTNHNYEIDVPQRLILQNLQTGQIIYERKLENIKENEFVTYTKMFRSVPVFGEKNFTVNYINGANYFEIMNYETGEVVVPFQSLETFEEYDWTRVEKVEVSEDGNYFIFSGSTGKNLYFGGTEERWFAKTWDIKQEQWTTYGQEENCYLEIPELIQDEFNHENSIIGTKSMQAAVYMEEKEIFIVDLLSGEITQKVPYSGKNGCSMAFFDDDQYLLLLGDEGFLMMWSLKDKKMVMKHVEKLESIGEIYTDDSSRYFGVSNISTFMIYYVDENHRFYRFADVNNGSASFQNEEIFSYGHQYSGYYTRIYDYETLKARAEEFLKGKELEEEELRMYYISNE